jgi:ABC-2 type transport system ATP-binding protein
MMLSVQELTGGYSRRVPVIHDLSFEVKPGEIVGLLGLNGAGKSTAIKHILGLLVPHAGRVTLDGHTLEEDPVRFRSRIGHIPEVPRFYEELTLWEHLELTALAYGLRETEFRPRAERLLEAFRMSRYRDWYPSVFSKGMQQKTMILCALLPRPECLIVDEPFVGLDPLAIRALLEQLAEQRKQGTGILLSTHILGMAEKHVDRLIILHEGRIRFSGTVESLRRKLGGPDVPLEELFLGVVAT